MLIAITRELLLGFKKIKYFLKIVKKSEYDNVLVQ